MSWDIESPEAGDFSGIDVMANGLDQVSYWVEGCARQIEKSLSEVLAAWKGEACDAWVEVGTRLIRAATERVPEIQGVREAAVAYLREVPGELVPEVQAIKRARDRARNELASEEARMAMAESMADVSGVLALRTERISELKEEIARCDERIRSWSEVRKRADLEFAAAIRRANFRSERMLSDIGLKTPAALSFEGMSISMSVPFRGGRGMSAGGGSATVEVPLWWFTGFLGATDPSEVRKTWDSMGLMERHALVSAMPELIGNLDGIPLGWRAMANEINVRNEIERLEEQSRGYEDAKVPADHASDFVLSWMGGSDLQHKIDANQRMIDYYKTLLSPVAYDSTQPNTWQTAYYDPDGKLVSDNDPRRTAWSKGAQLLMFDPTHSRIATYHGIFDSEGDIPAGYANVTTYVPGTGTKPWKWGGPDLRGAQMHVDANRAKLGSEAMIVYSDGPQPQELDALQAKYAQAMGPKLTTFSGVYVPKSSKYTVMGHSYGATTVAQAEATGLKADRILYVAPAGYGEGPTAWKDRPGGPAIQGLSDFPHTGDKPHYVIAARSDAIVGLAQDDPMGIHGKSQITDPQVTRLETGWLDKGDPSAGYCDEALLLANHSNLFNYETTAHENMVQVLVGGEAWGFGGPDVLEVSSVGPRKVLKHKDESDWPRVKIN